MPTEGLQTVEDSHRRHQRGGNKHEGRSSGRVRTRSGRRHRCALVPPPAPCVASLKRLSVTCGNKVEGEACSEDELGKGGGKAFSQSIYLSSLFPNTQINN